MSLTPGTKLGPYEIVAAVGAGGMGEVYKARDTRLEREVAIKVLPAHLSQNADLKQRFEREARAISALKHPHICTLHDVGQQGDIDYLVLEYLEGETLAKRLERGPFSVSELLKTAIQIADGLDRAHRSGIVHRDLKPGNVMLEKSGAKLLDFGLAKSRAASVGVGSGAPPSFAAAVTMEQSPLTTAGTVVGTIQYMSPEQVEGREADPRSDIFSFGAILYEMATGKRAFQGKSQLSVASAILEKVPEPISALQPLNPPDLERLIGACLEKDPEERIQTAHDVKLQLRWISEGGGRQASALPAARWQGKQAAWLAIPVLALLMLAAFGVKALRHRPIPAMTVRANILAPDKKVIEDVQFSPDGAWIALVLGVEATPEQQIWVRRLDQESARPIEAADKGEEPFWAPGAESLAFFVDGKLKRAELAGGPALTICEAPTRGSGTWGSRGEVLFSARRAGKIFRVPASGGTPQLIPMEEGWHADRPFFLADGDHFLYQGFDRSQAGTEQGIYVTSLSGGRGRLVTKSASGPRYAAGHLFFVRGGALMMQKFDPQRLVVEGQPVPIAERIAENQWGVPTYSVSDSNLAYLGQGTAAGASLAWYDREGRPLSQVGGTDVYYSPSLSRDGKRLAVDVGRVPDIWIYDLDRPTRTRFTFGSEPDWAPVWAPDGKRLVFTAGTAERNRYKLYIKNASGVGNAELLTESTAEITPYSWSPDGKYLLYGVSEPGSEDIWMIPLEGDHKPEPFLNGPYLEREPAFSFDGKWVAYLSTESGEEDVYVTDFPGRRGKWQVSVGNGDRPRWNANGREIFYLSNTDGLMAVPVEPLGDELRIGNPHQLFQTRPRRPGSIYQAMPDGKRFLVVERGESSSAPASLVLNWKPLPSN